ncbi:hypothetical protein D9615_009258 [Tricholomella constricta]|uniref:Uncharacterized protein n=1 Tax=Tricholomella constricta TaxID=117010 RepID=A0A8H5LWQ0_9AGAR|nr:hypothetical protein D9615_009258 [Tricholomella constricta]
MIGGPVAMPPGRSRPRGHSATTTTKMELPVLNLPFISQFSALHQSCIFAFLLIVSYLHRGARYLVSGLILAFVGYKAIVPISLWSYKIFKWIAMFGFYITYFQTGVGFIMTGIGGVIMFLENLAKDERMRQGQQQ